MPTIVVGWTPDVFGEVALRLGYAEASSFIHAHKRWFGRTPAARA